ncbi:unnamed protein product [Nyctereutes procyonoides]|uniref:(raccoon dog) hypothetical protein n=1 Tax=Nyctereutes procyonoides TaxID=34880 RepID=A0A811Y300_NYCPR|nr:unnamed protein product [Nyctereutes procyonoides]
MIGVAVPQSGVEGPVFRLLRTFSLVSESGAELREARKTEKGSTSGGRAGRAKADGPLHGDASGGPARTENSVQAGPTAPSSARRRGPGGRGRGPRLRAFVDRRPPAPPPPPGDGDGDPGPGGSRASGLGPPGTRAALSPARPRRAPRAAVGARRAASAPGTHLGHHLLELALRHRHGGRLATPVPAGRGSAAPGPPQAAPHSHTPRSRPPTPPPLATGSRPPGRLFRFRHVTSGQAAEAGSGAGGGLSSALRVGSQASGEPVARGEALPWDGAQRLTLRSCSFKHKSSPSFMQGPRRGPPGSPSSRSEPPCGTKHDAPAWASLCTCAAACAPASPRSWGAGSSSGPRTEVMATVSASLSLPPPVLGAHRVGQGAVKPGFEDMKCDRLHDVS